MAHNPWRWRKNSYIKRKSLFPDDEASSVRNRLSSMRGRDYRLTMLLMGCDGGIPLNVEGGFGFNRHLRRLVDEGLMVMRRPPIYFGRRRVSRTTSRLHTTETGMAYLRKMGRTPEVKARKDPPPLYVGDFVVGEARSLLVDGKRVEIARLVPGKNAFPERPLGDETRFRFAALDLKHGALVYRVKLRDGESLLRLDNHIWAGRLKRTGRGLVLDGYRTYRLHHTKVNEAEYIPMLKTLCPNLLVQRFEQWPAVYVHCRNDREEVVVNMLIENAEKL